MTSIEGDACPDCGGPIVFTKPEVEYGGEPVPEGMRAALERGDAIMQNAAPRAIKRIRARCANGHLVDFEMHSYDHGSRTHTYTGAHVRLADDFEGLTEPGWPRPRYRLRFQPKVGNYVDQVVPVPWVTPVPDFVTLAPERRERAFDEGLCQICGVAHEPGGEVVVFLNGGLRARPEDPRMDLEHYRNVILRAIDDAVMHPRCAKLALGGRSREIAEALLEEIGELLLFGESALEHAEPVIEHAVETAMRPSHPEAALAPPRTVARSTIAAAMRAVRFPAGLFAPRGLPADPIFDALATAALRCGWSPAEISVYAERIGPSISQGYVRWAYRLIVEGRPGDAVDPQPAVTFAVTPDDHSADPGMLERAVEDLCRTTKVPYIDP